MGYVVQERPPEADRVDSVVRVEPLVLDRHYGLCQNRWYLVV